MSPRTTERVHAPDGSYTLSELDRRHADWQASRPMTTRCAVDGCPWMHEGTVESAREAAAAHRESDHPELIAALGRCVVPGCDRKRKPSHRMCATHTFDAKRKPTVVPSAPLEEAAFLGAASSNGNTGTTPTERTPMHRRWTRETLISELQAAATELGHTPTSTELAKRKLSSLLTTKFLRGHGFDSFADLCRAAGLEPNREGRHGGQQGRALSPRVEPEPEPAAGRDPIRTADIPYNADALEIEATFLRNRAAALEQMASAIRTLADLDQERAA